MSQVVLGGGISGLSTAFYLFKSGKHGIKVFESSNRVGGWINTVKTKNGTLFELGPRTLKSEGKTSENTLALSEEVGLGELIFPVARKNAAAKKKLLYVNNQLVAIPNSIGSLFRINPPYMKPLLYALFKDLFTPKKKIDDDNIYEFVERRFGKSYAETAVSAFVCGVFGGDSKEISVKTLMKTLFEQEQKYGSVVLGIIKEPIKKMKWRRETYNWYAWTFQDGLQSLPVKLKDYLEADRKAEIHLGKTCTRIAFQKGKAIVTIDGKEEIADHLYSSLPSRELAKLLGGQHSFLRTELSSIPFVTIAVVNLEYEGDLIQDRAFGFLIPPNQNLPILGVIYDSCIFPQEGKTVLSILMGGKWFEKYFGSNPEENNLLQVAKDHVRKIMKIDQDPKDSLVNILRNCLPQYIVGHSKKIENIRNYIIENKLPLTLIGNSFDGVGIHDSIMSAKNNVQKALERQGLDVK